MSKQKNSTFVQEFMTSKPEVVDERTKISEAAALILEKGFNHLPVVSGDRLKGMFSHTDLMRIDFADSFGQDQRQSMATLDATMGILDACSTDLVTLKPKDTALDASKKLSAGKFHALPVVDENSNLMGLVTTTDLIKFYAELS